MKLGARLNPASVPPPPMAEAPAALTPEIYYELKATLHTRIVDRLDLATLNRLSREQFTHEITMVLAQMVSESAVPLNRREREQMVQELVDEMLGLGPLETLMRDPTISDILVNTFSTIYLERAGRLEAT